MNILKGKLFLLGFFTVLLISCSGSESDEGIDVQTFVKLSSNDKSVLIGNSTRFKVTDNLNNDVTNESQFFINGQLNRDGAVFNPEETGEYTITGQYKNLVSKSIKVNVIKLSGVNFVHRILYEDFTGTWCGNCPIASVRYEKLKEQNNKVVFLGVHGPRVKDDPFTSSAAMSLIGMLNVIAYPTILINNTKNWNTSDNNYTDVSFALQSIQPYSKIGIVINNKLEGSTLSGEYKIAFAENYNNLKVVVYIVENNIVYPQHNYFNGSGGKPILFEGLPVIENYTHHNVLRDALTPASGNLIPNDTSQNSGVYSKTFSYNIPADFVKTNVKVVVAILDSNNNVLNVREASVNTDNPLETL